MLFNSYAFVFVFLPLFVAGFYAVTYLINEKNILSNISRTKPACAQNAVELYCVILSFIFFAFFGIKVLGVLMISILWNYSFLRLIRSHLSGKKILIVGICGNIALLLFFKYAGFFADIVNTISGSSITVSILLPIAISFYTFSQISLLVDVYRGEIEDLSLIDYLSYIVFFPKILQGPIVRYNDMKSQFEKGLNHRWNTEEFMQAVMLFVLGLSKKVIIADTLSVAVDYGYSNLGTITQMDAILTAVCYSFQIYFDFSGYCDMGRGICRMVGMDLPVNFESPYKARNIDDFWKRWHMTLTAFFTKYVYIPLGGNRKGAVRTYINFMIIFVLSGFWHGAGLTFIVWGAMHGVLYVITRALKKRSSVNGDMPGDKNALGNTASKQEEASSKKGSSGTLLPYPIALILTFIFVTIAWVFFRAGSVSDACTLISAMTRFGFFKISPDFIECFQIDELWYIFKITPVAGMTWGPAVCMWIIILVSAYFAFICPNAAKLTDKHKVNCKGAIILAILLTWSIIKFANVSTYIYLGF